MIDPHKLPTIEEIEIWRKANGLTRADISALVNVSHSMYEKWCSPKSNRELPLHHAAAMQQHMSPRKEALPDRISVDASWQEVQAWSKAFKKSDDIDLQTWMLNRLNEAAEEWAAVSKTIDASAGEQIHRPSGVTSAPASENGSGQKAG